MTCEIRIARTFDDLLMAYAVRSAVYIAEQDCPFTEEFDGNDHCATHVIGLVGGEPAGCIRIRFFHDFAKIERLAVLKRFREVAGVATDLVQFGIEHVRRKGFNRIFGTAREGLEGFWARFGAVPIKDRPQIKVSGLNYTEMLFEMEPSDSQITIASGAKVILRPEGDWDRPGILELDQSQACLLIPAAEEDLAPLIALAAAEFQDLLIDAANILQVHRWSNSIFSVKADGAIVGGVAALFLNSDGKEAMIDESLQMSRPPMHLLARRGEPVAAIYLWMFVAPKNGRAVCEKFRRLAVALAPGARIYGRPANAAARQFFSKQGGAPLFDGSAIWMATA